MATKKESDAIALAVARREEAKAFDGEINQNNKTLIDKYEDDYKSAIKAMDTDTEELIKNGAEMKGLLLFSESFSSIIKIHESLHSFYSLIYNNQEVLTRFGSQRLKQLGYKPKPTFELLKDANIPHDEIEKHVTRELANIGFAPKHWFIKPRFLAEIEYMIDALRILVEPEFIPFENNVDEDLTVTQTDRYISSAVKISVWRRDNGKCVDCSSNEKLEYDHIIPVSKGGSNTERNIQLLCEKCNRKKSATIQ